MIHVYCFMYCVYINVLCLLFFFFFFKQKTAYEMRISDWSSDVCSSDLLGEEGNALAAKADVEAGQFKVESVETKPLTRNPPPPFTTSTLQQEAARKLGFSASHTMRIAQQLYEDGAITYMRTDGVQMDGSAISAARKAIADRYDGAFLPEKPRQYQTKAKNAQEAHEAIRPTDFNRDRAGSGDQAKQIGRESCRARGCTYVENAVVAVSLKKKKYKK